MITGLLAGDVPKEGDVAPDFIATDTDGRTFRLSELVEKGPVILAFFPRAFTPGWTVELSAYRDRYADISKLQGQVLAISTDDRETSARFKQSLNAPFPFVPDPDGELIRLYKVKTPMMSYALRFTFVVGPGRKVLKVEHGKDSLDPSTAIVSCDLGKRPR